MRTFHVLFCTVTRIALLLLFILGISSCEKKPQVKFDCGNQVATVDELNGTDLDHKVVYLCTNNTLTWSDPNNLGFEVEFTNESPFVDDGKKFSNGNPKSRGAKKVDHMKVFPYIMHVNGKLVNDPTVVLGGGH